MENSKLGPWIDGWSGENNDHVHNITFTHSRSSAIFSIHSMPFKLRWPKATEGFLTVKNIVTSTVFSYKLDMILRTHDMKSIHYNNVTTLSYCHNSIIRHKL